MTSANYEPYNGDYHARFYTSGSSRSTENAYLRKNVNLQTATATGQFCISSYQTTTILNDNNDRLYFIRFANANGDVASAGIKRENGVNKWILQTNTAQTTSTINIDLDQYYRHRTILERSATHSRNVCQRPKNPRIKHKQLRSSFQNRHGYHIRLQSATSTYRLRRQLYHIEPIK